MAAHDDTVETERPSYTTHDLVERGLGDVLDEIEGLLREEIDYYRQQHRSDPPDDGPDTRRSGLH